MKWGKWDTRHAESGAAAVEFALVSILLFNILFGILQYGLYFNDSLNTRQGLREAVRMGVVQNFTMTGCNGADNADKLGCIVRQQIAPSTGQAYAKVLSPVGTNWVKGTPLIVCAAVKEGTYGILPMPGGGWIYSKVQMSIEQDTVTSPVWPAMPIPYQDTPTGLNWSNAGC